MAENLRDRGDQPTEADLLAQLRASSLFGVVPEDELRAAAARLTLARFPAGETIIREGEPGDACYLLVKGQAGVVSRDLIGQEITLTVFGPGESFGEIALVSDRPRTATVRALSDVETYVMSRADFQRLEGSTPAFGAHIRRYVDLLDINRFLRKASPFARLPDGTVWRLANQLRPLRAKPGETVIREGEEGDSFYLVRSGRLEVFEKNERRRELEAGDCFGEVALLTGGRRTATVRTLEETELLALAKPDFDAVVQAHGTLRGQLGELARIRYRAADQALALPDPVTTFMPFLAESRRQRYSVLLMAGVAAFVALSVLAALSGQRYIVYAALVVGSFLGPVVYVVYLAESDVLAVQPLRLAGTFLLGAALGIPVAIQLESWFRPSPGAFGPALVIGAIEEPAKVLGVLWLLGRAANRFQMDGLIFGAAAGMGFAAFESMRYGLARIETVGALLVVLWLRTLLSPFGHGTWTGIVCASMWHQKGSGRPRLDLLVLGAFATSVLLHGLWDWQPLPGLLNLLWLVGVGAIGIVILRAVIQHATREEVGAVLALNPEVAAAQADLPRTECHRCGQIAPPGAHYCVRCGAALRAQASG